MGLKAVANVGGGGGGGTVTGTGTPGKLAKFATASSIGDSLLSESGTTITSAATAETFGSAQTWTVGAPNSQALVVLSNAGLERTLVLDTISRAVGVGVPTTPSTLLHVSDGVTTFAGTTGAGVRLDRATEALFSSSDGTRSLRAGLTGGNAVIGTSTATDLLLQRGNVTAATLTSGAIATLTLTAGGAGYTNGTYSQQALTGGTGSGATADFVVAGGIITSCVLRSPGTGYAAADALSCATLGAGAGLVVTVATISQVVAGSGNVTALGRIGAGTATPRAPLDAIGGALFDGAALLPFYNSAISNPARSFSSAAIGTAGSAAIAPSGNTQYTGLMINSLVDTTASTSNGIRGIYSGLVMGTSPAGYTGSTIGFQVSAYRREAGDLATAPAISAFQATLGAGPGVGSVSTGAVKTINSFILCGNVGHTIATANHVDVSWTATGNITSAAGLNCNPITGAGTVATFYGVRIQASTTPVITTRWGISQEDTLAKNYFAGNVGISTASPSGPLSVTPLQYNTGTASQSLFVITGAGTTFTAAMVGSQFVFANGVSAGTITVFTSATSITVSVSQTVTAQAYAIGYTGLQVSTAGNVGIGTTSPTSLLTVNGNLAFNSGYGSATTAYGCRLWINWNNVGVIAIRASGGVSSITDLAVGATTVNFSFTMPDLNFCLCGIRQTLTNYPAFYDSFTNSYPPATPTALRTTTSVVMIGFDSGGAVDSPNCSLAIFR